MKNLRSLIPWIILALYWPVLFIATHIPRPPHLQVYGRDVTLHFTAYMILTLLYWLARYGKSRPSLKQAKLYSTLFIIALYGAIDELLQNFVHRHCDFIDWVSDMCGALTALILLFLIRRLLYWLIVYWLCLFTITHWPLQTPLIKLPNFWLQFEIMYIMAAYLVLTLLWWRSICDKNRFILNRKILFLTLLVIPLYLLLDILMGLTMNRTYDYTYPFSSLAGIILGILSAISFARHHTTAKL